MSTLWYLVAWIAAHTRMASLARRGAGWKHAEIEADWWAETLSRLNGGSQRHQIIRPGAARIEFWRR